MLRKIIQALIPNNNVIFFDLFIKASKNVLLSSNLLVDVVNNKSNNSSITLHLQRKKAVDINKDVIIQLNTQFITPIDRGDIFHLSAMLLKLTKRIIKIDKKLQLYAIDTNIDDCLIRNIKKLQEIAISLHNLMIAFKNKEEKIIEKESQKTVELDENIIEDLGQALKEIQVTLQYDMLTVIKLKEVYQAIESATEASVTLCDSIMRVYVKEI